MKLKVGLAQITPNLGNLEANLERHLAAIEEAALKKEKDAASKDRLKKIEESLQQLKEENKTLRLQWQSEKEIIDKIREIKSEIENAVDVGVKAQLRERSRRAHEL